jgi:hypothetical protein
MTGEGEGLRCLGVIPELVEGDLAMVSGRMMLLSFKGVAFETTPPSSLFDEGATPLRA